MSNLTISFILPTGASVIRSVFNGDRAIERRTFGNRCDTIAKGLGAVSWHRVNTAEDRRDV